jgi:hypothetical protein
VSVDDLEILRRAHDLFTGPPPDAVLAVADRPPRARRSRGNCPRPTSTPPPSTVDDSWPPATSTPNYPRS